MNRTTEVLSCYDGEGGTREVMEVWRETEAAIHFVTSDGGEEGARPACLIDHRTPRRRTPPSLKRPKVAADLT